MRTAIPAGHRVAALNVHHVLRRAAGEATRPAPRDRDEKTPGDTGGRRRP